jgi:hypothetical protein
MTYARPHFRSSYGDAGGAGARENPTTAWLYAHQSEFWFDDAGWVFLILGGAGLQTVYAPTGQTSAKFFPAASADQIVNVLRSRGRRAAEWELASLKAGRPVFQSAAAPAASVATFNLPAALAPAAAATPGKKPRKPKPLAIYQQPWFPFAVGGAAISVLIVVGLLTRPKAAS